MAGDQHHLLVVDDDARVRDMLTRFFEGEGYRVSAAADGVQMKSHLRHNQVDAILLDLTLPGGQDGLDLVREIRPASDVPIIMLTGRDDVVDRILGIELGADDYIAKPFHLREVHARLKSILRRRVSGSPQQRHEIFASKACRSTCPVANFSPETVVSSISPPVNSTCSSLLPGIRDGF